MQEELNKFLEKYLNKFEFLEAIIVSDRDDALIGECYRKDKIKYKSSFEMLSNVYS